MDSNLNGGDPRTYKSKFKWWNHRWSCEDFLEVESGNPSNSTDRNAYNPTMESSNHANAINPGPHQANASTSTANNESGSSNAPPNNHGHKF